MSRKSLGFVKLAWTCDRCEGENPGPRRFCNSCGSPQPAEVEFHQPAQEIIISKPDELAAAKAGADVHCPYCGARNPASAAFCGACGGGLEDAEKREAGKVLGAHRSGEPLPKICPSCNTHNLASAVECAGCGDNLSPAKPEAPTPPPSRPKRSLSLGVVLIAVVACLAIGGVLWALFGRTEETIATVSGVNWTRSLPIEVLGEAEAEGWFDQLPEGAQINTCETVYRETVSEPVAGAIEVCGTPYTIDEGSGYGEVVQDCEYEIYDDYCSYTATDWIVFDTVTTSGRDLFPFWPEVSLASNQRVGEGEERYEVQFQSGTETYTFSPNSEREYLEFTVGSEWNLRVNAVGGVVSLEPAE